VDFSAIFPVAPEVGYIGLTLVSFFGSLVPFVPLPSFLLLATMSVGDQFNLHVLAIISAITATGAKVIVFSVSYGGRRIIGEKSRKRMRPFERLVKRYGAGAAFFAAATPMPDDLIYVPLGLAKYNPKKFFIATLTGKLILSYVIVFVSHYMGLSIVEPYLENVEDVSVIYIGIAVFAAMMTSVVFLLLKLDWQRILARFAPWTLDENNNNED